MEWYIFFPFFLKKKGSLTVVYCILGSFGTSTDTTVPPAEDSSLSLHNRAGAVDTAHSYCSAYAAGLRKIRTSTLFDIRGLILSLPGRRTRGASYYIPQAQLLGAGWKLGEKKDCGRAGQWLPLLLKLLHEGTREKLGASTKEKTFPRKVIPWRFPSQPLRSNEPKSPNSSQTISLLFPMWWIFAPSSWTDKIKFCLCCWNGLNWISKVQLFFTNNSIV